ncbi:hypothetical protein HPB48_022865 [Haemaphysalis longicornis]|uniref:Uncharacterized protein n=1 Tax=Haemaphysalis longicornis TaxID=44386 RepID=A0A9J6FSX1_HAELO|nr:hypothetical protein HPB48_022865 [Haemaphysalis longicornis]
MKKGLCSSDTQALVSALLASHGSPLAKKLKPATAASTTEGSTQETPWKGNPIEEGSWCGNLALKLLTDNLEGAESGMEDDYEDEEMNVTCGAGPIPGEADVPDEEDMAEPEALDEMQRDTDDGNEIEIVLSAAARCSDSDGGTSHDLVESGEDNEMEEPLPGGGRGGGPGGPPSPPRSKRREWRRRRCGGGRAAVGRRGRRLLHRAEVPPSLLVAPPQQQQHRPSLLPRVRNERLPSSQSAAGFEEGDDSIVPSTPTLFVPRRTDGFAEAVGSPHVPHGGFVFGGASEGQTTPEPSGLSQLASQEGVGVDDTRMDLSHFEEGGGRSVPSTPLQISPTESRDASLFQGEAGVVEEPPDEEEGEAGEAPGEVEAPSQQEEEEEGRERRRLARPRRLSPAASADPIVEEPSDEAEDLSKPDAAVVTVPHNRHFACDDRRRRGAEEKEEELVSSEPDATNTGGTVDTSSSSEAQAATEKPAPSGVLKSALVFLLLGLHFRDYNTGFHCR